jgi:penicillin-binding protein 1B
VKGSARGLAKHKFISIAVMLVVAAAIAFGAIFTYYYFKYQRIVDARLSQPLFANTAKVYAAPFEVRPGQTINPGFVVNQLTQAGYSLQGASPASQMGTYSVTSNSVTVYPGPLSYHAPDSATITFANGSVSQITSQNGQQLAAYQLEPLLITGLSDANRVKRRLVTYNELPQNLVDAVTAIEDRRFFEHGALSYTGILRSALNDITPGHHYLEGASTIDMQVAKMFFLTPARTWRRKFLQVIVTLQLEHKLTKQQIFQFYANEVPLGQRGSFAINGFGEAAYAFFGKSVGQLTLDESALLAGLIQGPTYFSPTLHPQRATERRNMVLDAMVQTGDITKQQAEQAKARPIHLIPQAVDAGEAPYFVDMVRHQLAQYFGNNAYNDEGLRIYTSLDPDLQKAATEAVARGMQAIDKRIRDRHARIVRYEKLHHLPIKPLILPQVALVALNPHTGQILALVGGKNYAQSQLNHALAERPTGSTFKPIVNAAAFNTALAGTPLTNFQGVTAMFSPVTMLNDEPTTFTMPDGKTYSPHDFENKYFGVVTARKALAYSLNNATISLAEMVGLHNIVQLAHEAGIVNAQPTPSVAIGTYDATPIELAGAYTMFDNNGVKITPWLLASVRSANGDVISNYQPQSKPLLDPRVAFLTTAMMEAVVNDPHGTGYQVRTGFPGIAGFSAPVAAKTGTENDSWFAGFTSNLLCVVWVGNDNYSDLHIQGAHAALPIWTDFMDQAQKLPQYSDMEDFTPPQGVIQETLDKNTNLIATPNCSDDYTAWFLDGTQPTQTCDHQSVNQPNLFQRIFGVGKKQSAQTTPEQQPQQNAGPQNAVTVPEPPPAQPTQLPQQKEPAKKKRGFWSRLFGHHDNSNNDQNPQQ